MLTMEEHYDVNSMDSVNNNSSSSMNQNSSGLSKAELRKSNKPIMEKRRRARINNCLNELKSLILDAMKKPARHTKLEKADILEMTVKHLQTIQRQQLSIAMQTDPTVIHKFKSGFSECTEEINRYLNQLDGLDNGVRQRLSNHLNNCVTGLDHVSSFSNFTTGFRGTTNPFPSTLSSTPTRLFPLTEDVNNNGRLNVHGTQLIPSRLPTGEVALIVPNSNSFPLFSSNLQLPTLDIPSPMQRFSAFAKPSSTNLQSSTNRPSISPPLSPISSVSSCGDESIMHTSSDFASKVSQWDLNQSMLSQASLSPDSSRCAVPVSNIQQSQISSTSETANTSRKRLYNEDKDNDEEVDALNGNPPSKVAKKDNVEGNESSTSRDGPSDMWRPW